MKTANEIVDFQFGLLNTKLTCLGVPMEDHGYPLGTVLTVTSTLLRSLFWAWKRKISTKNEMCVCIFVLIFSSIIGHVACDLGSMII